MPTSRRTDKAAASDVELDVVVRAARVFAAVTAESIAQAGPSGHPSPVRVLVLVSEATSVSNSVVADALGMHISNASRICDRLVQAGLLNRRDAPANRRQIELTLTAAGAQLLESVTSYRRAAFSKILAGIAPGDRGALTTAFAIFAEAGEARHHVGAPHMP